MQILKTNYILIPLLLILSTNAFCANKYKIIKGKMNINVPVDKIQFEYATEIDVVSPKSLIMYAPKVSTNLARLVLRSLVVPKNNFE